MSNKIKNELSQPEGLGAESCSRIEWTGDIADDCWLICGDWLAHAECMTDDINIRCDGEKWKEESWYLGVTRGDKQIFHSGDAYGRITSGEMARAIAEAIIGENYSDSPR